MQIDSAACVAEARERRTAGAILGLLLERQGDDLLWSVEELVGQLSASRMEVLDGLAALRADGLVHRLADFVFPTRAARSFDRLVS